MPYTPSTVPKHVPAGKAARWSAIFNNVYDRCDAGKDECEGRAFAAANAILKEDRETERDMSTTILAERIELLEGTLDPEARTVEVVLIRPGWSQNGRYYSKQALSEAVNKFEGAKAYANHPTPRQLKEGAGRDLRDLTGQYTNVHVGTAGELRATRKVFNTPSGDAVWPLIVESIGSAHPPIGVSINALGKGSKGKADGREGLIVESIDIVNSADDVDTPAAGGGFERLIADSGPTLIADLLHLASYEEITEARPDVVEAIKKQNKRIRQDEQARALVEERDAALTALTEARAELARLSGELETARATEARLTSLVEMDRILRRAHFDAPLENIIREQLIKADPSAWVDIVDQEQRKLHVLGERRTVPVKGLPQTTTTVATGSPHGHVLNMDAIGSPDEFVRVVEGLNHQ